MQLLRDNLTLWTSSEGADAETSGEAAPKEEPKAAEAPAAAAAADKPAETTEEQPAAPAAA